MKAYQFSIASQVGAILFLVFKTFFWPWFLGYPEKLLLDCCWLPQISALRRLWFWRFWHEFWRLFYVFRNLNRASHSWRSRRKCLTKSWQTLEMTSFMTTELFVAYSYMTRALSSIILYDSILKKILRVSLFSKL